MRCLGNLFLILFLIDGGVSLLDDMLFQLFHVGYLAGIRNIFAFTAIGLSIIAYVGLGFDRRLPKMVFIPLIVFTVWRAAGLWPLSMVFDLIKYGWAVSTAQLVLGLLPLLYFLRTGVSSVLMTKEMFESSGFSFRNSFLFTAANFIILPFALVFLGLSSTSTYIYKQSAGFVQIRPSGIYMTEKIYRSDNQAIRLTGMIHVAERSFYNQLADSISTGRTVVLAEGITDTDRLIEHRFSYANLADLLGMTSQEKMTFKGKVIGDDFFDNPDRQDERETEPHIVRADIDINRFHPDTIDFLNVIGKHFLNSTSFKEGLQSYNTWVEHHMPPDLKYTLMEDIISKRNREVIRYLDKTLGKYDTIVIPWGALHMPGIEKAVLDRGFTLEKIRRYASIDFTKVSIGRLYRKLSKEELRWNQFCNLLFFVLPHLQSLV